MYQQKDAEKNIHHVSTKCTLSAGEVSYLRHMEQRMLRLVGEPDTLSRWLESLFPPAQTGFTRALYGVGALPDGRTVFTYANRKGQVIDGKVMAYGPDGHRIKIEKTGDATQCAQKTGNDYQFSIINCQSSISPVTWLHALDRLERPMALPLFGEDLLGSLPFAPVCLVESEKTALVAKLWRPDCTWLATGGKSSLTADRLHVLAGRTVLVWPDADAINEWMETAATLGPRLSIDFRFPATYLTHIREGPAKGDLADLIEHAIRCRTASGLQNAAL